MELIYQELPERTRIHGQLVAITVFVCITVIIFDITIFYID